MALANVIPAIGAGAGLGIGALELAKRAGLTPTATAAIVTAAGLAGTALAPKGALHTASTAVVGLGAGLLALDLWQNRSAYSAANKTAAETREAPRRQAGYVTRDEVQAAVREQLGQYHDALSAQLADLRNAFTSRSGGHAWEDEERNAEPVHTEVFHGEERNAHAWEDEERNAEPVHTEVMHGEERNAHPWEEDAA